ncbi:MgtC/SapB family protein [Anaerotignum sp. MSJ-24]|uniref:MgtC/SapB family protein n=1 Tax=Anaerotignum sp. MSJ-24 TaxID=2841521 RepID=UPI001C1121C4|nr:MgtC/SapB family protein [Anaerotignum sp. MSJ-24]MBU5464010.1 MgtC/SapB family protein [Anaerotignum sp. MSJ-24]
MNLIPDYLREICMQSIILRFILAVLGSGLIGLSRGKRHHAAGFRTHLLVCVGAASVMMINQYICEFLDYNGDMGRMGAQVISGIGFLGAGTILVTGKKHIRGLTSAAGLWASACMGLAVGIGFYEAAVIMSILLFIILSCLEKLDEKYIKTSADLTVYIEYDSKVLFSRIIRCIRDNGWHINDIEQLNNSVDNVNSLILVLEVQDRTMKHGESLKHISDIPGVLFVEEI